MEKKNTKLKKNIYVAFSYVILLTMLPVTLIFSTLVGNKMSNHIRQTMQDSAYMCAEIINRQYANDMLMMEGLAVRMAISLEDDPVLAVQRLISTADRYGMKRITFTSLDGSTLATDNAQMNLTGVDNFERARKGERLLTNVIQDVADGRPVNIYSLPVYKNGTDEVQGVLSAVYHSEVFENLLAASFFEGEGYTYIIDSKGNVIIDTNHSNAIQGMDNFLEFLQEEQGNEDISQEVQKNLASSGSGFCEVEYKEGERFAYYMPLEINDWYVISAVPKSVAESTKTGVMFSVIVYCLETSIMAVFVILSIRHAMREKNSQLKQALYVDNLTGGRSYEKFRMDCKERLKQQTEKKAAFVFLDIDNFNLVSTLYGHEESVDTIRRVYSMIQTCVEEQGIIGRNSSDQFCVMYFYNEHEEFEQSIQTFVKLLHDNAKFSNMLRPSIGVYFIEDRNEKIYDMMNKARIAHETIKQNGDTIIAYYDAGFRDMLYQDRHMEDEMEQALERHEFVPFLQPKYDAATGEICGAEALIRWVTKEGQIIPPGKFIPLAENNGFVRNLDREMFMLICNMQKELQENGMSPVPVSVNVSRQLLYDKHFADDYINYIKELGISAELIELEITESALFENLDLFRSTLEKLRDNGFRILMDDFGTGYSSLMMLHTVPIDVMKLDKSFIDDYADEKGSSIIQCVLSLAKMLKIPVVAEGVETEEQYKYLKEKGCEFIQGYYFSKPVSQTEYYKKIAA